MVKVTPTPATKVAEVIGICFFARAKISGRFFESAPNSSHEFINNGLPDTLFLTPRQ